MHLLGRWPCVKAEDVLLLISGRGQDGWVRSLDIFIDGISLNFDEKAALAWRDGFRPEGSSESNPLDALRLMARFWTDRFREGRWNGQLIHWTRPDLLPIPQRAGTPGQRETQNTPSQTSPI
jgi:hypothetical protein